MDQIESAGAYPDQNWLNTNLVDGTSVIAARVDPLTSRKTTIRNGSTFEFATDDPTGNIQFGIRGWSGENFIMTVIYYNSTTGQYSLRKRLFKGCVMSESDGDLPWGNSYGNATCNINYSVSPTLYTVKYTYFSSPDIAFGREISVRVKPLGSDISMTVTSSSTLSYNYTITTKENETMSETTLTVDANKTMPTIFDHVLYNGKGEIRK